MLTGQCKSRFKWRAESGPVFNSLPGRWYQAAGFSSHKPPTRLQSGQLAHATAMAVTAAHSNGLAV